MNDEAAISALYSRRTMLEATLGLVGVVGLCGLDATRATAAAAKSSSAPRFFSASEAATVDAIVGQIIPADETPGAREIGVTRFIDHALAGILAPLATKFRSGLADFEDHFRASHVGGESFANLSSNQQIQWLQQVERSPFFESLQQFFESLQQLTVLGALCMPEYGGNKDGLGWQLIGFADLHAFTPPFGYYDRDYPGFPLPEPAR